MAIPGPQIVAQLEQAAVAAADRAAATARQRDELAEESESLAAELTQRIRELAAMFVPDLTRQTILRAIRSSRLDLQEIADRRDRRLAELVGRQRRLDAERRQKETDWLSSLAETRRAEADYEVRKQELQRYLDDDDNYQAMQAAIDTARLRLEADERRVDEVRLEAQEKRPDYEADSLFMYLHDRRYGQPQYRAGRLTTRLDRWVARLIDYPALKRSYRFLTETPAAMKAELKRRTDELESLVETSLEAIASAKRRFDLKPLEHTLETKKRTSDRSEEQYRQVADSVEELDEQIAAIERREGGFHEQAIQRYADALRHASDDVLDAAAASTSTPADDDLVAEIRAIRDRYAIAGRKTGEATEQASAAKATVDDLSYLVRRATQDQIGSERASFPAGFRLDRLIGQVEKQVIDRRRALEILKAEATIEPTLAERTYNKSADLANSPTAQILIGTAAQAALPAIRQVLGRRR